MIVTIFCPSMAGFGQSNDSPIVAALPACHGRITGSHRTLLHSALEESVMQKN